MRPFLFRSPNLTAMRRRLLCYALGSWDTIAQDGGARKEAWHLRLWGGGAYCRASRALGRRSVYAFTRPGYVAAQEFAKSLGCCWAGGSDERPRRSRCCHHLRPRRRLVPAALRAVRKGGTVVCGGIHMSDIPSFPYSILWGERVVRSVANLTRQDAAEFLALAPRVPVRTTVELSHWPKPIKRSPRCGGQTDRRRRSHSLIRNVPVRRLSWRWPAHHQIRAGYDADKLSFVQNGNSRVLSFTISSSTRVKGVSGSA